MLSFAGNTRLDLLHAVDLFFFSSSICYTLNRLRKYAQRRDGRSILSKKYQDLYRPCVHLYILLCESGSYQKRRNCRRIIHDNSHRQTSIKFYAQYKDWYCMYNRPLAYSTVCNRNQIHRFTIEKAKKRGEIRFKFVLNALCVTRLFLRRFELWTLYKSKDRYVERKGNYLAAIYIIEEISRSLHVYESQRLSSTLGQCCPRRREPILLRIDRVDLVTRSSSFSPSLTNTNLEISKRGNSSWIIGRI